MTDVTVGLSRINGYFCKFNAKNAMAFRNFKQLKDSFNIGKRTSAFSGSVCESKFGNCKSHVDQSTKVR